MLDRPDAPTTTRTAPTGMSRSDAAQRRVFRSKVDTIRPTYGFEDVSLAPGTSTIEPNDVDLEPGRSAGSTWPSRSSPRRWTPSSTSDWPASWPASGGLAVLNLEGVQARYDDPDAILARIAAAADGEVQDLLAEVYAQPIREELIARRLEQIHAAGSRRGRRDARPPLAGSARSAPSTAPTCSSSRARSGAPGTWRPATTRCRSPSSPGSCRSRSPSATRPTPRPPSR